MSLFSRDHGMPSWAECFAMVGFGLLGLGAEVYYGVKWLKNR